MIVPANTTSEKSKLMQRNDLYEWVVKSLSYLGSILEVQRLTLEEDSEHLNPSGVGVKHQFQLPRTLYKHHYCLQKA